MAAARAACKGARSTPAVCLQEIRLPDGRVLKVFSKCTVSIFVEKGANHREKLRMELLDS